MIKKEMTKKHLITCSVMVVMVIISAANICAVKATKKKSKRLLNTAQLFTFTGQNTFSKTLLLKMILISQMRLYLLMMPM